MYACIVGPIIFNVIVIIASSNFGFYLESRYYLVRGVKLNVKNENARWHFIRIAAPQLVVLSGRVLLSDTEVFMQIEESIFA